MVWQIISVFLQAAGVLLLLWALVGWLLLGRDRGGAVVLACRPGKLGRLEAFLRCYGWLRGSGLLQMPVILSDCGLSETEREQLHRAAARWPDVECCLEAELSARVRMEAEEFDGPGTATGDCSGSGISEL